MKKCINICGILLLLGLVGCSSARRSYNVYINTNEVKSGYNRDKKLVESLDRLTSANFFEHTQAARRLIRMGPSIIPDLLRNSHLLRESNDTVVPVCQTIIKIIFSRQKKAWVIEKCNDPNAKIAKIARADLARRASQLPLDPSGSRGLEGES